MPGMVPPVLQIPFSHSLIPDQENVLRVPGLGGLSKVETAGLRAKLKSLTTPIQLSPAQALLPAPWKAKVQGRHFPVSVQVSKKNGLLSDAKVPHTNWGSDPHGQTFEHPFDLSA